MNYSKVFLFNEKTLPVEMHVLGYKFCGPGTKLAKRLARCKVGINLLDEACREYDIAYAEKKPTIDKLIAYLLKKRFFTWLLERLHPT